MEYTLLNCFNISSQTLRTQLNFNLTLAGGTDIILLLHAYRIVFKNKAYDRHLDKLYKEHCISVKFAFLIDKFRPYASIK